MLGEILAVALLAGPFATAPAHASSPAHVTADAVAARFSAHLTKAQCAYVASDINGDGFADAVVNDPGHAVEGQDTAGAFRILYGTATGLTATGNQYFDAASPGYPSEPAKPYGSGPTIITGDFNGDCYADVVVGDGRRSSVTVLYGGPHGLSTASAGQFTGAGFRPSAGSDATFGFAVAAGDFNGDGTGDLAVGADAWPNGGAVAILYGSAAGLTTIGAQWITEATPGVPGSGRGGGFGQAVAAGDITGDGCDDLIVGAPETTVGGRIDAGAVTTLLGSPSGVTSAGSRSWSQDSPGVPGTAEVLNGFGSVLAAGDLNGDGHADLAAGTPDESLGRRLYTGAVNIFYGTRTGLTATGSRVITETAPEQLGPHHGDHFGAVLTIGDFNGDGRGDLAVGSPLANVAYGNGYADEGVVDVLSGTPAGLATNHVQHLTEAELGVIPAEEYNHFGAALTAVNVTGAATDSLLVGVPGEDLDALLNNGAIYLVGGGPDGLTTDGVQFFSTSDLKSGTQKGEEFGAG